MVSYCYSPIWITTVMSVNVSTVMLSWCNLKNCMMKFWNWYLVVDSKKYTGSDEISAKVLKIQLALSLKCARIVPIFKRRSIITRKISYNFSYVTPTQASAAFKRHLSYPSNHLNMYYPISVRQWGYISWIITHHSLMVFRTCLFTFPQQ